MRFAALFVAALLLSGCAWVHQELEPTPPPAVTPEPKPDVVKPRKSHVEKPVPATQAPPPAVAAPAATPPPPVPQEDFSARCHEMAVNRAADAQQLGASAADQARVQSDTYRECMAQSVK